ncbi:sugar transferase [Caldalkalibacillus thermarum]|uniref:sugar transferase n=1 Tax=Caldalkalibacillus thermarum TaxID=296745 RepID=UPI001663B6E2|nr:sugar transferase [Caldalkalibacillus thermarum]GGK33339.1 sugar transferase [Caldalkalibacillus thermarum]
MSQYSEMRNHKFIIIVIDLLLILAAYVGAFYVRYNGFPARNWESFVSLLPWILLIGLFFISVYELYSLHRKSVWDVVSSVIVAVTFMAFLTMAASFLFREFALPRSIILMATVFTIILFIVWKIVYLRFFNKHSAGQVLVVGDNEETQKIASQLKHPLFKGTKIKHVQSNTELEKIDELMHKVDFVVLCPNISKEKKSAIIYQAIKLDKVVYVIPSLYELLMSRSTITSFDDTMVMAVRPFGLTWDEKLIKRAFDLVVSGTALILLAPLFILISLLIKLDDPKGRIIYKQKRLGLNNKEFTIYKFRTMIEGAEKLTGPVLATENDPRITRIGHFLRKTRLDELPQLFNVFKGDMSIVGPRPEREFFIKQLTKKYATYQYRSTVKPGITGYAQIMGKYSTDAEDKLRYDLYYIRNYSFWLDLIIILRTFIVLLDKTKAEGTQERLELKKKSAKSDDIYLNA